MNEMDVVKFKRPVKGWAAGTEGTIVDLLGSEAALVEITNRISGRTLDLVAAQTKDLRVVWSASVGEGEK